MKDESKKRIEVGEEVLVSVGGLWQFGILVERKPSQFGPRYDKLVVRLGDDPRSPTVERSKVSVRRPQ